MIREGKIVRLGIALCLMLSFALAMGQGMVAEIEIRGLKNVNREPIMASLRLKVGQPYTQVQLDQDRRSVEEIGFFQAVDARAEELPDKNWKIVIEVVEFPVIKELRIIGNSVVSTEEIERILREVPSLPIAPGYVYNLNGERACTDAISKLYSDRGYFAQFAEFGPMPGSPETITVSILELVVDSVAIQGATRTRPYVFQRLIRTKPGEAFNLQTWTDDLRRIYNTQWFETVEPLQRETDDIAKIALVVNVKEARTGMFNVGVQVDPRSSVAGLLSYSDSNFRGTGQSVRLNFLQGTSGGGTSVNLDYGNPIFDDRGTALNVSVFSQIVYRFMGTSFGGNQIPTEDSRYFERRTGAIVGMTRTVKRDTFLSTGVRFENIKTSELDTSSTTGFIQQDGDVASISGALTINRRDVDIEPSRGNWIRFSLEPGYTRITKVGGDAGGDDILGSHTFVRTGIEYRHYFTNQPPRGRELDAPRRVVAFRAKAGLVAGTVPFFEQFFVGGSDTLRGYPEDRFWGKNMAAVTLEYRHPVQKSFNAIAFVDYGGAWGGFGTVNEFTQSKSAQFKLGYGLGFSFRTPLGPIRLDFGWNQDGGSRTHFLIGTSF